MLKCKEYVNPHMLKCMVQGPATPTYTNLNSNKILVQKITQNFSATISALDFPDESAAAW
jgi:hypothetical protein